MSISTAASTTTTNTNLELPRASSAAKLLSRQQINVIELCSRGLTAKQVGEKLNITEKCVKFHKTNIFKILQVKNIIGASMVYKNYRSGMYQDILEPKNYKTKSYLRVKAELDVAVAELAIQTHTALFYKQRCEALERMQSQGIQELVSTASRKNFYEE